MPMGTGGSGESGIRQEEIGLMWYRLTELGRRMQITQNGGAPTGGRNSEMSFV